MGARNGIAAVPQWHDPAGFIILAICFLALWGLVHLVSGAIPVLPPEVESVPRPLPCRLAIGLALWLLVSILSVEA